MDRKTFVARKEATRQPKSDSAITSEAMTGTKGHAQ